MAKELFIMFVYDTQCCQKEDDDPQDAVLYFHPSWVSDQQRLALCGQLMGATQFFLSSFSCPRILALDSGKFALRECGRFILAVGTDRNIRDWVLEHRADTLHDLVQFYHRDLETVSSIIGSSRIKFVNKLNEMFETYLPILHYAANLFGNIPTIQLPKSASNVFLEALQILQSCQETKGVLGGAVLYFNKVVSTQLSSSLTKQLVSTDPYRIRTPAEHVSTPFHLPVGVQLLHVYLESNEFLKLSQQSAATRFAFESVANRKQAFKKIPQSKFPPPHKDPVGMMKRDTSRIFTVPEEREIETELSNGKVISINNFESVPKSFLQNDSKVISESVSVYNGSECTTPMKDINKVLHAKVLSICCGKDNEEETENMKKTVGTPITDLARSTTDVKVGADDIQRQKTSTNCLVNYSESEVHSLSLSDLSHNNRLMSHRISLRYYSFGLPKLTRNLCGESGEDDSPTEKLPPGKHFYNTITDPLFPVFRCDGLPLSRSLFEEYLSRHYRLLDVDRSKDSSPLDKPPFIALDSETILDVKTTCIATDVPKEIEDEVGSDQGAVSTATNVPLPKPAEVSSSKQEVYRRSLSLPLKTMTSGEEVETSKRCTSFTAGELRSPAVRPKTLGSLQLTPLMSKLSLLAMEEKTSGFCSRDTTPGDGRDFSFPVNLEERPVRRPSMETETDEGADSSEREKAVLYVCGQQNMALMLLLQEELAQDPQLIHSLWEISLNSLSRLEAHLQQCLDHFPQGSVAESYSFLCLDPNWDMLQKGGSWGNMELDMVSSLHNDFTRSPHLTEMVVRCEDSTVYGYQCGKMEVFYEQSASSTVGLPTPSDLMGVVPLKARRRLERDHGIILLK